MLTCTVGYVNVYLRMLIHISGLEERLLCALAALYSEHIIKTSALRNFKWLLLSAVHVTATVPFPA
jgi:hypothetical protein